MAKITEQVRLGLSPELLAQIRAEVKLQRTNITSLIRTAVERHLSVLEEERISARYAADKPRKERR
jgi:hypothetical protein